MVDYIFSLILLALALSAIELRKSYHEVPKNELRHLAREGDQLADRIYKAVAYEETLDALLWLIIILCITGSLILLNRVAPLWLDFLAIVLFLWMAFAWLPRLSVNSASEKLVVYLTPGIVFMLNYFHRPFQKVQRLGHSKVREYHTGIYDQKDLVDLLKIQKNQPDSRINPSDLDLIIKALKFSPKKVGEFARTWSKIEHLTVADSVGPVLLDGLHKKDQLFVPVTGEQGSKEVVGMVDVSRLDLSEAKSLRDVMDRSVYYLNEEDSLKDAALAMTSTGYPVFIVLDKDQQPVGMITLKEVLGEFFNLDPNPKDYSATAKEVENEPEEQETHQEEAPDSLKTT